MRKKKITMSDIANAVGVSQPTVSVILNGSDSIKVSNDTRDKVLKKAQELGYKMKTNVQHASTHKRIAFLVNSLNMHDPFINAITSAKVRAWEMDAVLVVYDYEDNEDLKASLLKEIESNSYQALIYAANTPKTINEKLDVTLPVVFLNCTNERYLPTHPAIVTSDFLGGYKATRHLLNHGYRDIAMVTGETWSESSQQRERGFRQAITNADILLNEEWIVEGNWSVKQSYLQTEHLLSLPNRPRAIFCASDLMALGVYQAIAHHHLEIPKDIAVMGYDNQLLAAQLTPTLSSIDLPYDEMGKIAVETALSPTPPELLLMKIEGDLYPREST